MAVETKERYGFVYITTNLIDGKKYLGKRKFTKQWEYYLGSGKHLKRAINKYGKENFVRDIIAIAYSDEELSALEISFIQNCNAVKSMDYYNIATGGEGGNAYIGKTDKEMDIIKAKMSKDRKGEKNCMYGKHHSEETRIRQRIAHQNQIPNRKGTHHTEKSKKKISDSRKGSINSAKKVICITTGESFESLSAGGKVYGVSCSAITQCCHGTHKYSGKLEDGTKLVWSYFYAQNEVI